MLRFLSEQPLRLPQWTATRRQPGDPAIFGFNDERDDIVATVARRVADLEGGDSQDLELILNDAAYHEIRRLEAQGDREAKEALPFWRSLIRRIARMSDHEKRRALDTMLEHMARDVAGNFDHRVYDFARGVAPRLLTGLMQPSSLPAELFGKGPSAIDRLLNIEGAVEKLRRLEQMGTLIYVPTHSSNMDSVLLATALDRAGLSPVVYGAGKNLFTNPIISFFMHNLGAYRVDRRIHVRAYKSVLKAYAQVMVERNYHSLFFPGGTRSRSGMIESRLKLGLLGSAVQAYSRNQARGVDRPVYFVPTTINYALVLEAETLIDDWLKERGQARYIIEDDEFSRIERWATFFRKIVGLSSACVIRFADPLDPFGNRVDDEGRSLAPSGRLVDPRTYTLRDGKPVEDPARDAAYTQELGEILVARYREETVIMATQIVAHALFRRLVEKSPNRDLYARMRMRGEIAVPLSTVHADVGGVRDALLSAMHRGEVRVSTFARAETPERLVARALEIWSGYHERTVAHVEKGSIVVDEPMLLLYYQNRLTPFAEMVASEPLRAAATEIFAMGGMR
jgi:glycerol-3-phosphate O-acyltransferase